MNIMTNAKDKANELLKESAKLGNKYVAKRHCNWLVDEIIKETKCWKKVWLECSEKTELKKETLRIKFWEEVKKEIQIL